MYAANKMAEAVADFDDIQIEVFIVILEDLIADFDRAVEMVRNGEYRIYQGCDSMADVAREVVAEAGYLRDVSKVCRDHFNYESYGNELETSGTWRWVKTETGGYYIEIPH